MSSKFVADFIVECTKKGIVSAQDICNEADLQIKILNEEIGKAQALKIKRSNLQSVIRQLGETKKEKQIKSMDFTVPFDSIPLEEVKQKCFSICAFIEENPGKAPTEIIESVGNFLEQESVYLAIKWLGYHNIVRQKTEGHKRVIYPGEEWNNRPINENN